MYGPPAAGKDTVTRELSAISPAYRHYQRLKIGSGRRDGYRFTDEQSLNQMRANGEIIWENRAYGAVYAIDAPSITSALAAGTPVVHVGQPDAVAALVSAMPHATWVVVDLWCPRETAARRLAGRGSTNTPERLAVWDSTPRLASPDVAIDTALIGPAHAAQTIDEAVRRA